MSNWRAWGCNKAFLGIVFLGLLSCDGGSSFNSDDYGLDLSTCTTNTQNEFVHRALQDRYYWYDQVPANVAYSDYSSPSATLNALKYAALDRFSYVTSSTSFDSFYNEGQYVGFGFGYDPTSAFIRFVYTQSPFGNAGIKRGDKIISIDGQLSSAIIAANSWGSVFGDSTVGVSRTFVIEHQDNSQTTITSSKAVVTINTVLAAESFTFNSKKYAYLVFKNFITPSYSELATAFNQFKADSVQKLILDLRYNGGGSVAVAAALASYVYQPNQNNIDIFTQLRFNDKYQSENYSYFFSNITDSLDLNEVIVLTTESSCSASEMVINALEPFVNVTVIGAKTCGKPVGMRAQNFCDKKLLAINFQGFNSNNFGDFFNGIAADCAAEDDVNFEFGDFNEPMLKAALEYDNSNVCVAPSSRQQRSTQAGPFYQGLQSEYASE